MSDENLGTVLDILAEQGRADLDQAHGEHILLTVEGNDHGRDEATQALFEAIGRARRASEAEGGKE
jgi:hypothetical protein